MNHSAIAVISDGPTAASVRLRYAGFQKLKSWLLLWELGLPTLKGIIFAEWSKAAEMAIADFAGRLQTDKLLIRSDSDRERGDYPPGGNLSALSELKAACRPYLERKRLVFLLEPRSRFEDHYSISLGFMNPEMAVMEVVGPGFDASDLKRGDSNPHEWLTIDLRARLTEPSAIRVHSTLSVHGYQMSWEARARKVGRLLGAAMTTQHLGVTELRGWLDQHDNQLLGRHWSGYDPIPAQLIAAMVGACRTLPSRLQSLSENGEGFIVSMSYWGSDAAPIYWDVVWPQRKFVMSAKA